MESDFQKLLGHALLDHDFRNEITSKDEKRQRAALERYGINASDDVYARLNEAVDALEKLNSAFGVQVAAT